MNPDDERTEAEEIAAENAIVAQAQRTIDEAKARQAARQREADIQLLAAARNELAERTAYYEQNLPVFRAQEQDYANARMHLQSARDAVNESERARPKVAEYLPRDAEVLRWQARHLQLEQKLAEVQAEFAALPNPEALRPDLARAAQQITTLTLTVDNMVRKLEGFSGKSWLEGGGVSNVGAGGNGKAWIR